MRRSLPLIVLLANVLVLPACVPVLPGAPTDADIENGFSVLVLNAALTTSRAVAGATVKALDEVCTTSELGGCSLPNMPFATISVTVTQPGFVELTKDVVKKKGQLNHFTFELQPK